MDLDIIKKAVGIIGEGKVVALTGAGISVESGIAPFRGPGGLWAKYDPALFDIARLYKDPAGTWELLREIFFTDIARARPNPAHLALAAMERAGLVTGVVTQNIDGLHQKAGSRRVIEFHGGLSRLRCLDCRQAVPADTKSLAAGLPRCAACGGVLKPDVVFFGEVIPPQAAEEAAALADQAFCILIVGTTGEVMPAAALPRMAKRAGATAVEINLLPSRHTDSVTDLFIQAKAGQALAAIARELGLELEEEENASGGRGN